MSVLLGDWEQKGRVLKDSLPFHSVNIDPLNGHYVLDTRQVWILASWSS